MPHIHTEPGQHDLTASAFIIRTDGDEPRAMLHKHRLLDMYLQFGGHVELHENPWQAITHELKEEAGYDLSQLKLLQPKERLQNSATSILHPYPAMLQTHPFGDMDHKHTDIGFAFVADQPPRHKPEKGESTEFLLLSATDLKKLKDEQIPKNVRLTFLFILDTCLPKWEQVLANDLA